MRACTQLLCDLYCLVRILLLPSESKTAVNYFKEIRTKSARDLKQMAQISNMDIYLSYSFEICSAFSFYLANNEIIF